MQRILGFVFKYMATATLLSCGLLTARVLAESSVPEADEARVRAAMVIGILRFTSWEIDFGETLNICLLGSSASFEHIDALQNSRVVPQRMINVSRIKTSKRGKSRHCQVLIVGANPPVDVELVDTRQPFLLICDDCESERRSASVVLRKEKNRIRFDIYLANAKTSRVKFRAAMLELAAKVEGLDE